MDVYKVSVIPHGRTWKYIVGKCQCSVIAEQLVCPFLLAKTCWIILKLKEKQTNKRINIIQQLNNKRTQLAPSEVLTLTGYLGNLRVHITTTIVHTKGSISLVSSKAGINRYERKCVCRVYYLCVQLSLLWGTFLSCCHLPVGKLTDLSSKPSLLSPIVLLLPL